MRRLILPIIIISSFIACGGVDDAPLGGPYGGTTDPTDPNNPGDPNNLDPNNNNAGDDAGAQQQQQDSGTQQPKDSGTQQPKDSGTQVQDSGQQQQTSVTWTTVFNTYLASS